MEKIKGKVQLISEDRKGIKVNEVWYNNKFKTIDNLITKDSTVEIEFIKKGKNNYWQKIELVGEYVPKEKPIEPKLEKKIDYKVNESKTSKESQANFLLSYSKDILICMIENDKINSLDNFDKSMDIITDVIIKYHKKLREKI